MSDPIEIRAPPDDGITVANFRGGGGDTLWRADAYVDGTWREVDIIDWHEGFGGISSHITLRFSDGRTVRYERP